MTVQIPDSGIRAFGLGRAVNKDSFTLPATTTGAMFTVAGGKVLVTSLVGEVTTVVQNQACTLTVVATPTVGAVNDIGAASGSIASAAVGNLFGVTGLAADAVVSSTGGGVSNLRNPIVVAPGVIGLKTSATNTGATKWTITYIPIDDGASIVAA